MTPQEIFDTVATHLFTQGEQAKTINEDGESMCAYRSPEGKKCAVGCLIPDELYRDDMEGCTASTIADDDYGLPAWFATNYALLSSLQRAHDFDENWESEATLKTSLSNLANEYSLSPEVLDSLSFPRKP